MRIGSLFSGIGGLELGIERALRAANVQPETVFQVEQSAFCRFLLAHHWPHAQRFDDVCTVGAAVLPPDDLLCGGFPCQDVSAAGGGAGFGTEDNPTRSGLWYEFRRIIEETRPRWIVVENVASGAKRWLPRVRRDLWTRGYASVPVGISAAEVGARHRRERVFVIASDADRVGRFAGYFSRLDYAGGWESEGGDVADAQSQRVQGWGLSGGPSGSGLVDAFWDASHPDSPRSPLGECLGSNTRETDGQAAERDSGEIVPWQGMPPRPWMVRGVHGLPRGMDRVRWKAAGWTGARIRSARIKALGNAVVPAQVAPVGFVIGLVER